jgi:hypothetical protein
LIKLNPCEADMLPMGMNIFFRTFQMFAISCVALAVQAFAQMGTDCTKSRSCSSGYICIASNRESTRFQCVQDQSSNSNASMSKATAALNCPQLSSYQQKCQTELSETASNCDEKGNQGMNSVSSMAGQVALAFGAQSAASIQSACSSAAAISTAANAALAAYRLTCSSSIQDCSTACNAYASYAKSCATSSPTNAALQTAANTAAEAPKQCINYTAKIGEAQQAMSNIAQTAANASQCASLTSADGTVSPEICAANPTLAGCSSTIYDCNNASMASNKVCICSKNPSDPACLGTSSVVGGETGLGVVDNGGRLSSTASSNDLTGDLYNPTIEQAALNSSGGDESVGGKQGAGVSFGSGGSGAGGAANGGKGDGAGADKAIGVNAGYYGGGGGGGSFGGGGSDGSGGGHGGYNPNAPGAAAGKGGPDLRQFLPGGKMSGARGVAGATGPDGITGPHSDIWKKVNNRYQVMSPSLLP